MLNAGNPLYVELGLNPNYFQLHSSSSIDPIHAGFNRPTFAGVLTGYNMSEANKEFWEVYIRRHGDNQNKVKVGCVFSVNGVDQNPFAGITASAYSIMIKSSNIISSLLELPSDSSASISSTDKLRDYASNKVSDLDSVKSLAISFELLSINEIADPIMFKDVFPNLSGIIFGDVTTEFFQYSYLFDTSGVDDISYEFASTTRRLQDSDPSESATFALLNFKSVRLTLMKNALNDKRYNVEVASRIYK